MKTEQIHKTTAKQELEKLLEKQPIYMLKASLFLRLLIFFPVAVFESVDFGKINIWIAAIVGLKLLVFEVVFWGCAIVTAKLFTMENSKKKWFYFIMFLSIVIYGAYFSFMEISVFTVNIGLDKNLAKRLFEFMILGLVLSLVLGEGGAFLMFLSNSKEGEKQETETEEKQKIAEPQPYNEETEENNTDILYSPTMLWRISDTECMEGLNRNDEKGTVHNLQEVKNKFNTYSKRIKTSLTTKAKDSNERKSFFFNTIVWFIESKADNKFFGDEDIKPKNYYNTSQTDTATSTHKINPVQTALQI